MCSLMQRVLSLWDTPNHSGADALAEAEAGVEVIEPPRFRWTDPDSLDEPDHPDDEFQVFTCPCGSVMRFYPADEDDDRRVDAWCDRHSLCTDACVDGCPHVSAPSGVDSPGSVVVGADPGAQTAPTDFSTVGSVGSGRAGVSPPPRVETPAPQSVVTAGEKPLPAGCAGSDHPIECADCRSVRVSVLAVLGITCATQGCVNSAEELRAVQDEPVVDRLIDTAIHTHPR